MKRKLALAALFLTGALIRLGTWKAVIVGGEVFPTQNDGWYHLRRAQMTIAGWPHVPRFDAMINAPRGGTITWGVFFDWILATLALPWPRALAIIGVFLPVALGVVQLALIYVLVRDLRSPRAGLIAVALAAILPAVVHYSYLGALDHDPFIEVCLLAALWSVVRGWRVAMALSLAAAFLAWPGAVVTAGLVAFVLLVAYERKYFETAAIASLIAAIVIVPWVLTSGWPRASFEGLSLLHVAVLAGIAAASAIGAMLSGSRSRTIIATLAIAAIVVLALAPIAIAPFASGVKFAAGGASIQKDIAEGQPLDAKTFLTDLTLLPLFALAFARNRFAIGWLVPAFVFAILHTRFTYTAGAAACVAGGLAFDTLLARFDARRVAALAAVILITIFPAYKRLFGHGAYFHENGMDAICARLANRENGNVWAPWWFGHYIVWRANKPVVASPFLTIGQSEFGDAARFYFTRDAGEAQRMLAQWNVRYVIVTADAPAIESLAAAANVDPRPFLSNGRKINARAYVQTVQGRLALIGAFGPFVEIDHSREIVRGPAGYVPRIRVYAINR